MRRRLPTQVNGWAEHETPTPTPLDLVEPEKTALRTFCNPSCLVNMEAGVNILLPIPPSTNNLFATVNGRRVITRSYNMWRKVAYELLRLFKEKPLEKPYGVHIRLNLDHKSDIDNRVKPILDALVASETICGDQWVNTIRVDRDRTVKADSCQVEVWSLA